MSVLPFRPENQADDEPACPACGSRLRYRGRRGPKTVWECQADDCPATIVEHLGADSVKAERPGARR